MNFLQEIRSTCDFVVKNSTHVIIDNDKIDKLFENDQIFPQGIRQALNKIQWDSEGWHYCEDVGANGPLTAQYILVLDALNFCFWPCPSFEYADLAGSLKNVFERNPEEFSSISLSEMDEKRLKEWFPGWEVPLLSERVKRLREIGWGLLEYDGLAFNLVRKANHSANKLVDLVLKSFPGFRDTIVYEGTLIHFYKRAQILVADLWGAYGKPTEPSHPLFFSDLNEITMFADYRVPQILLHVGILKYSEELLQKILNFETIPFGSVWETEIRAATVITVERLRTAAFTKKNLSLLSIEIDWLLWNWGEKEKDKIKPHHRTLTIYY